MTWHVQGMLKAVAIIAPILVMGCNTPSLAFRGVEPVTIAVDGSTFDVRIKDLRAEAIRTNMQYAPRMGPIGGRASAAIAQVSSCKVRQVGGDQALISATLDCGKGGPPPLPVALDYECNSVNGLGVSDDDLNDLILECTAVKRP